MAGFRTDRVKIGAVFGPSGGFAIDAKVTAISTDLIWRGMGNPNLTVCH